MVREIPQRAMAISAGLEARSEPSERPLCRGCIDEAARHYKLKGVEKSAGNENGLGYLTIMKIDL